MAEPEPWSQLERHPDGTPKLVFEDYAAMYPERYGDPDMPKTPRPQAPLPGHETPVGEPALAPPQFGDGQPFQMNAPGRVQPSSGSHGKLVTSPMPGAVAADPLALFGVDPDSVSFVVVQSDVWEEVYTPGTSTPSYVLKWARGTRVPAAAVAGVKALVTEQEAPFVTETKAL